MRVFHWVAAGAVCVSLFACASKPKSTAPATPPLVTARQHAQRLQAGYEKTDASARVGVTFAVKAASHLAAVGDVPTKDFKSGDLVSFIDANEKVVANGHVTEVQKNLLIVKYEVPAGGRVPQEADLVVRLKGNR